MFANRLSRFSHLPHVCSLILLSAAISTQAQTVTNVTGSITSTAAIGHQVSQDYDLALQGSNFSLTAFISSSSLVRYSGGPQVVTINASATTSDATPMIIAANPGSNFGTLTYNGASYQNLQINLNINAQPATVANVMQVQYFYQGSVSSVPFSLTGTVTVYDKAPTASGVLGTPLFSVNFSGSGLYSANAEGSYTFNFGRNGTSTYQFLANPIGFHTDPSTQGAWSGPYGGEGYLIANGPTAFPAYAAVSVTQASTYTWSPHTSDARALQNGFNAASRIASTYYGNNFNINIRPTDNNPHPIALYLLDFDNSGRTETLAVTNADTGATLDTETLSNFQNGVYAVWNLQGNIRINVRGSNGSSAEVSGILFGPPQTILNPPAGVPTAAATFNGTNTTAKGAWSGFGGKGYLIANGPSAAPTSATLSVNGASTYTWAAQTTDPRALELNPPATVGIASAYTQYASTSFRINLNSPSTQTLALYLLDWDNAGRVETITITDLSTGIVLDTETASAFQGGVYYSWLVSGNVVVTITPSGSSTPVISGVFLN